MSKEVKISKAKAFEIDPTKKYILVLDKHELTLEDALHIGKVIKKWGAKGISVMVDDTSKIKVIEL